MSSKDKGNRREPNKKSLVLYYDRIERFRANLTPEQFGLWFSAVLDYELYGEYKATKDEKVNIMIDLFKPDLDNALEKWREKSKQSSDAGIRSAYGITSVMDGYAQFKTEGDRERYQAKYGSAKYPPESNEG